MLEKSWLLETPLEAVIFDCDGTLSAIEGIDELARMNGVYEPVQALTAQAMGKSGINPDIYQKRLELVNPSRQQVIDLAQAYIEQMAENIPSIIQIFQRLNKTIYIVSAGLFQAIEPFAHHLGVPTECLFAIKLEFDAKGHFVDFDRHSPLIHSEGKREIVKKLQTKHLRFMHIGDGLNDYVAHDIVTRFVGYGGIFYRQNLASLCPYYILTPSLASVLPLGLTKAESDLLLPSEKALFEQGLRDILEKRVLIQPIMA